jgi:type II secretory pathway component PulF
MPNFRYKAKKGLDETVEGTIEAESQDDAINNLAVQGLFPFSVVEVPAAASSAGTGTEAKRRFKLKLRLKLGPTISSKDKLAFTQKLTTLVKAKLELLNSLKILYEQTENPHLKEIILQLYNQTKEGKPFSESLGSFPKIFPPLFVNMITAGEASGHLDSSLEQIADFMYQEENLKNRVLVALSYPVLLLSVGVVSIFVMINFVVPRLKPIFQGMGRDLPAITKVILKISELSSGTWLWILGAVVIAVIVIRLQKGSAFFKNILLFFRMHAPVVKRIRQNQELTHFARSLVLLLNGGVTALRALELASPTVDDPRLKKQLAGACAKVAAGERLSKSLEECPGLPVFFVKMVAVGEESGRLSEILEGVSKSYVQQVESDIGLISSLLEPVLILGLGLVLGTIVMAILLPTFQVTQMVH